MSFKVKKKENLFGKILGFCVRIFKKPPEVINLNGEEHEGPAIYIGNHSGASGPMNYRTFVFKPPLMIWGAHQMCEGYRSRRRYLIDVFYGQKLGYGKTRSWISGTLFAIVSGIIYRTAGMIPVYYDNRVKKTFEYSLECLFNDVPVLIFPENSDRGYFDVLNEPLHPGYISLARIYKRKTGKDLPVYPMAYSKSKKKVVIGKPLYLNELLKTMDKHGLNEKVRFEMNSLHYEYIEEQPKGQEAC